MTTPLDPVVIAQGSRPDAQRSELEARLAAIRTARLAPLRAFPPRPQPAPALSLNAEAFMNALATTLAAEVEGFAAAIQYPDPKNPATYLQIAQTGGYAIDPNDGGARAWSASQTQHVASVSKLPTAIAMTKLLLRNQISFEAAIGKYFPPSWTVGPNIADVTFAQLLTMTSGIDNGAMDYESMKAQVAAGVSKSSIGTYTYANMNFSLCRILLTTILMYVPVYTPTGVSPHVPPGVTPGGQSSDPGYDFPASVVPVVGGETERIEFVNKWPSGDDACDLLSIQTYQSYLTANVLIGGETARLTHAGTDALAYACPKPPNNGWNSGDLSYCAGAAGWHFSPTDVLQFMGDFRRAGTILTRQQAQTMLDDGFGIDWIQNDGAGTFYEKDGYWYDGQRVEQATAFFLPNQSELVVLVNSTVGADVPNDTWIAWVVEPIYKANLVSA
jgi:hypothetical protein